MLAMSGRKMENCSVCEVDKEIFHMTTPPPTREERLERAIKNLESIRRNSLKKRLRAAVKEDDVIWKDNGGDIVYILNLNGIKADEALKALQPAADGEETRCE